MNLTTVTDAALFKDIPNLDVEQISSMFYEQKLGKGQVLYYQGEAAESMCIVRTGLFVKTFESESQTFHLSYQRPGDVIGESEVLHSKQIRYVTTTARLDSVVWRIDDGPLNKLLEMYPIILRRLFDVVGERFIRAKRKITYLAFLDARMRIVHLLRDYLVDHPQDQKPQVWKITQQELGEMLALTRESVARALNELDSLGIIQASRGRLSIIDDKKLRMIARSTVG